MESPAAEASSKAFAAAEDNLGLFVRYQTAACVSATTTAIRSRSWENCSTFLGGHRRSPRRSSRYSNWPKGRVRSSGASAAGLPRCEGASRDPRLPAAGVRKRSDRIENRLFQSHRKAHLPLLSVVFRAQKRGCPDWVAGRIEIAFVGCCCCAHQQRRRRREKNRFVKIHGVSDRAR